MGLSGTIITLCWVIFLLYWALNWYSVKSTKETAWKTQNFRWGLIWLVLIAFLLFSPKQSGVYNLESLNVFPFLQSLYFEIPGVILTILGLIIAIIARRTLAKNWSSNIDVKQDHELITKGVYRYMRHPIYSGVFLMILGSFIVQNSFFTLIIAIIVIGFFIFKIKTEEKLLTKHFPKEYPAYMKKTKALIPFIY